MNQSSLPAAKLIQNMPGVNLRRFTKSPNVVSYMIAGNLGFYGLYLFSTGPFGMRLQRRLTVTPESSLTSLATFHMCHTNLMPLLVNCGVLATIGMNHFKFQGQNSFLTVFGIGCAAASLAVGMSSRYNPE